MAAIHSQRAKTKPNLHNQAILNCGLEHASNKPTPPKSVKFNPETIETSFGGTQTPGRIKTDTILKNGVSNSNQSNSVSRRNSETVSNTGFKTCPPIMSIGASDVSITPVRRHTMDDIHAQSTPECFHPVQFETPVAKNNKAATDLNESDEDSSSVTVAVRVRPFSQR